jgi:hypothetical protein
MTAARSDATSTLLSDGRVLVAGGFAEPLGSPLASAELYDPKTGKFSPTGAMTAPRWGDTATLLRDGRVVIAGGASGPEVTMEPVPNPALASAELYDPKTGTFSRTGSMTIGRIDHTATLLPDGRVLIAGGNSDAAASTYPDLASAELCQP